MDKIICVGKNYLEHALELGEAVPDKPVLFLKPPSILKQASAWGGVVSAIFPQARGDMQPECEIVLKLDSAKKITAVSIGLDGTLRSHQAQLKKNGHPWTTAKVFPDAAIVGPWIPVDEFNNYMSTEFSLTIDGELRQRAFPQQMMMKPDELVVYIKEFFPLCTGDLIYTGTPVGVSPVQIGSRVVLRWGKYFYSVDYKTKEE